MGFSSLLNFLFVVIYHFNINKVSEHRTMETPELHELIKVIRQLRNPVGGCPWDLEQTHATLLKSFIEETYEFVHATEKNSLEEMESELGDVLLQIVLHAVIAEQANEFTFESVAKKLREKLVFRHPHVFGELSNQKFSSGEVLDNWDKLKDKEKELKKSKESNINESLLHLPSLMSAHKIGKRSKKYNFDWSNYQDVLKKVDEELNEVKAELKAPKIDKAKVNEEIGDLLFSVAQLARHLDVDPEESLRDANKKFIKRFNIMEKLIEKNSDKILELNPEQLENYWSKAKNETKK